MVDIGSTDSIYRYPHIVLSCDDEDRSSAYSSVYGRLLVDRAVTDGLLEEDGANRYVAKADVENVEVEGYYSYPTTHVSVKDLRAENIVVKTKLCTKRGLAEGFEWARRRRVRRRQQRDGRRLRPRDVPANRGEGLRGGAGARGAAL